MSLQDLLEILLFWGLYPLWLLAGAGDYLCHRLTNIERTSGSAESWFHVWQFLSLVVAVAVGALLEANAVMFGMIVAAVLAHSVLAYMDVSYTDGRRYISPVEQLIHGFMNVLPVVAVSMFGVLHWQQIAGGLNGAWFAISSLYSSRVLLLASFVVLAGAPIIEELLRTRRYRGEHNKQGYQAGLATVK